MGKTISPGRSDPKKWLDLIPALALVAVAVLVYEPSFNSPFSFDDLNAVVNNRYIRIPDLSPPSLIRAAFQDFKHNRPLTNLTLALNFYFNQLDPFGYHLVNFFFFILTGLGIWLSLRNLLLRLGHDPGRARLLGFLTALVWTVHPLNVQAVTYIVQRHSSMAGAFSIWSLYFFHLALSRNKNRAPFFFGCALLTICALLSKESAVTLPALLLAYKIYFFDRFKPGWLRANWKWFVLLLVFGLAAAGFALRPGMASQVEPDFSKRLFTSAQKFYTEPKILVWYWTMILFPIPQRLALEHQFQIFDSLFQPPAALFFFLLNAGVILLALIRARKQPALAFAVLWYYGLLLVEALPLPIDLANEHRLYLASLSLIAPFLAYLVLNSKRLSAPLILISLIAAGFAFFTWQRNQVWQSPQALWRDASAKAPRLSRPWSNYCYALASADQCNRAIKFCGLTIALDPASALAHNNLGICLFQNGRTELAEENFLKAAELAPSESLAFFNLGYLESLRKNDAQAMKWYLEAISRDPYDAQPHYNLALTYGRLGRKEDYQRELIETLKLRPEWVEPRLRLAQAYLENGQCPQALSLIQSAPANDPRFEQILKLCR